MCHHFSSLPACIGSTRWYVSASICTDVVESHRCRVCHLDWVPSFCSVVFLGLYCGWRLARIQSCDLPSVFTKEHHFEANSYLRLIRANSRPARTRHTWLLLIYAKGCQPWAALAPSKLSRLLGHCLRASWFTEGRLRPQSLSVWTGVGLWSGN